jgi:hypothetical protein
MFTILEKKTVFNGGECGGWGWEAGFYMHI